MKLIINRLALEPVPCYLVQMPAGDGGLHPQFHWIDLLIELDRELLRCEFRGVAVDRLGHVLKTGIDVPSPDDVMWVAEFEKAWEYGKFPKVVLAFDPSSLEASYTEVDASIGDEQLAALKAKYRTMLFSKDGKKVWFSRLPEGDRRAGSAYEVDYARCKRTDVERALKTILIFARPEDSSILTRIVSELAHA